MKKLFFILIFLIGLQTSFAKKYALIIAVGDYPAKTGWGAISSVNDVQLIKQALINQGFLENDITVITNEQATKKGVVNAISSLQAKVTKGDVVVIHYSGHGQQIFDDNGDEIDGKDEAIIPYDAFVRYTHNYTGQNHLRDDELGNIIANFRNALGKNGQLLFLLDSCHSGSSTRGGKTRGGQATFAPPNWTPLKTDKTKGSAMLERTKVDIDDAAPFVMISGASADELNYEYNGFGSLSFAFSKAMSALGSDFTYRQLYSNIAANMNVISPKQTPTIEGDVDYLLFKGDYIKQQPYFEINKIARPDVIQINGGKLQRLFNNTTVTVLPAGTNKVTESKILAKGTISKAKFNEAIIKLDTPLKDNNAKNYWVFIDKPSYGDIALKVYLDASVKDKSVTNGIAQFLEKNALGTVVKDTLAADVIVIEKDMEYTLNSSKGVYTFNEAETSRGVNTIDEITTKLFNFAQGQYLKNLSLKNYDYEFEFKLIPVDYNVASDAIGDLKPEASHINEAGIFEVKTVDDYVVLQVTNKSNRPLYFSIIEINSKGEISPFMPNNNCKLSDDDRKLSSGQTMIFKDCLFNFGLPYERLVLKGFASSLPINFQPTVDTSGEGTRGTSNPLESFIQQSYTQSRGSTGTKTTGSVDGYSTEFVYEIVKN